MQGCFCFFECRNSTNLSNQKLKKKTMPSICILSGTDRKNSRSLDVAQYLESLYKVAGSRAFVVSLEQFPLHEVQGGRYGEDLPGISIFRKPVLEADGIVMIVPEYNGSFPGILKLFLDYLPFPEALSQKPVAFVGVAEGAFGALRAVEQLQMVCAYRNAFLYPQRVFLQRVSRVFDKNKGVTDEVVASLVKEQSEGFTQFVASQTNELVVEK